MDKPLVSFQLTPEQAKVAKDFIGKIVANVKLAEDLAESNHHLRKSLWDGIKEWYPEWADFEMNLNAEEGIITPLFKRKP